MKNKKLKFTLAFLTILMSTSCGADPLGNNELPHLDGTEFQQITTFTYQDNEYALAIPKVDETYYLYKESGFKTSCSVWTINYEITTYYLFDKDLSEDEDLFNQIHTSLTENIDKINKMLDNPISSLYKYNETIVVEDRLNNIIGGEVSFMYYDHFLPVRLLDTQAMHSYNISIPINRSHLLMNNDSIISPLDGSIISKTYFYNLPKITRNTYY